MGRCRSPSRGGLNSAGRPGPSRVKTGGEPPVDTFSQRSGTRHPDTRALGGAAGPSATMAAHDAGIRRQVGFRRSCCPRARSPRSALNRSAPSRVASRGRRAHPRRTPCSVSRRGRAMHGVMSRRGCRARCRCGIGEVEDVVRGVAAGTGEVEDVVREVVAGIVGVGGISRSRRAPSAAGARATWRHPGRPRRDAGRSDARGGSAHAVRATATRPAAPDARARAPRGRP